MKEVENHGKRTIPTKPVYKRKGSISPTKLRNKTRTDDFLLTTPFWKEREVKIKRLNHTFSDLISDSELEQFRDKIRRDYCSQE